jgi:predicted Mrr-cat superfamily restriction endonuclease
MNSDALDRLAAAGSDESIWVVRAGKGAEHLETFRREGLVAVAHGEVGDLSEADTETILNRVRQALPDTTMRTVQVAAMLRRLAIDIQIGDWVISLGARDSHMLVGLVTGPYAFRPMLELDGYVHTRPVDWWESFARSSLPHEAAKALGTPQALFRPAAQAHWRRALLGLARS